MKRKPRVAIVNGGQHYHVDSIERAPLARYFDEVIYVRDLAIAELAEIDILIIPCRTNPYWVAPVSEKLQDFMRNGGTLAVMGEVFPHFWLPDIGFREVPVDFWWWLEPGADLGLKMTDPDHSLCRFMNREDATFHLHGVHTPLHFNQKCLIETKEGECVLFEDADSYGPGRLISTTLDPFFHHGAFFMPATTRFLKAFIPWLIESEIMRRPDRLVS